MKQIHIVSSPAAYVYMVYAMSLQSQRLPFYMRRCNMLYGDRVLSDFLLQPQLIHGYVTHFT